MKQHDSINQWNKHGKWCRKTNEGRKMGSFHFGSFSHPTGRRKPHLDCEPRVLCDIVQGR